MTRIEARTWTHTFLQGPDEERLRELRAEAARLEKEAELLEAKTRRRGGDLPRTADEKDPAAAARQAADEAATAADAFADEAEARGVPVELRSVGRRKWRDIVRAHPPRDGNDDDQKAGINTETFSDELVPACLTLPALSPGELEEFLDSLTEAQFDLLSVMAWRLNKNLGADPKERLRSGPAQS